MNGVHKRKVKEMPKNLENIKEDIIQTTRELIVEKGYNQLNIREIARKCGIATGTLYNYFKSKQAIISALLDEDWKTFHSFMISRNNSGKTTVEQLETLFNDLTQMMTKVHQIWVAGFPDDLESGTLNKLESIKAKLRNEFARHIELIIDGHIQKGQEKYAAEIIAKLFFSTAYGKDADFEKMRFFIERILD